RGHGDATFDPGRNFAEAGATSVAVGDLDGDGVPDVVTSDQDVDSVSVRPGLGDGSFGPRTAYHVGVFPRFVIVRDLDGDGRLDVAVANYYSTSVSVLLNRTTVSAPPERLPASFALTALGANPASDAARFEVAVPRTGSVRLDILDLQGRRLATLQDGPLSPGRYARTWEGARVGPGLYLARLTAPGVEISRKIARIR